MNYALMVYSDQSAWESYSEEEAARLREEAMPAWIACFEELGKADPNLEGFELESASTAKRVSTSARKNASHTLSPLPSMPTRFMPSFQSPQPINGSPCTPKRKPLLMARTQWS